MLGTRNAQSKSCGSSYSPAKGKSGSAGEGRAWQQWPLGLWEGKTNSEKLPCNRAVPPQLLQELQL